jgi:transcriptional regulator with XRE-family HTH domain
MKKKNVIGSRVRKARKDAKPPITQLDLVARLGLQNMKVDQSIISKIESGTRPVYDYELPKIAKALKVTVEWLLNRTK